MTENTNKIFESVAHYYAEKLHAYGATPKGVDWNDTAGQYERFDQLAKLIKNCNEARVSVFDLGCGYGEFLRYLRTCCGQFNQLDFEGVDLSNDMIAAAQNIWQDQKNAKFTMGHLPVARADFGFASGIFNVRLGVDSDVWLRYILDTLTSMDKYTSRGFAFNCLSAYSDKHRQVDKLYYADPVVLFDYCKRKFSKNVALLHDYNMYEFTILVRK